MNFLSFIHWNTDPVLFKLGFFSIRWYSLLFILALILGYKIMGYYFRREKVTPPSLIDSLLIYVIVSTIVGARLGHCLFYDFAYYSHHIVEIFLPVKFSPKFEFTGFQGLASHGGAIGILVGLVLFSKKYKVDFLWVTDRLSLIVPLSGFLIRLGNLMNSEMIGNETSVPWAFIFERIDNVPRHPGQLYEAALYIVIFVVINLVHRNTQKQHGFIFGLFLVLLFSARFIAEFFKIDQAAFEAGMVLNMGQLLSIPFIILGASLMVIKSGRKLIRDVA